MIGTSLDRVEEGSVGRRRLTRGSQYAEGHQHERERLERIADRYVVIEGASSNRFFEAESLQRTRRGAQRMAAP